MTWLIMALVSCLLWPQQAEECMPIMNQIVEEQEIIEREECEKNNCYWFTIGIVWFPYDSDANRVANYRYNQSSWNIDMIATFIAENGAFDVNKVSKTNDRGLCMLHRNKTNRVWIENERWLDPMYQAEVCLDKWNAVPNPSKTWYGWNNREKQKKKIYYFN